MNKQRKRTSQMVPSNNEGGITIPKRAFVDVIRKGGKRRGYITLVVRDDNQLEIGYSLCELKDRFDGNLGVEIALKRGRRWATRTACCVHNQHAKGQILINSSKIVPIPHTLIKRLVNDTDGVRQKFTAAQIPEWFRPLYEPLSALNTLGRKEVVENA